MIEKILLLCFGGKVGAMCGMIVSDFLRRLFGEFLGHFLNGKSEKNVRIVLKISLTILSHNPLKSHNSKDNFNEKFTRFFF
jgi:hypothetical protein